MSKSLSCGSEEGRSVDGVSLSPRTVGAADRDYFAASWYPFARSLGGGATSGDAGFGRRASGAMGGGRRLIQLRTCQRFSAFSDRSLVLAVAAAPRDAEVFSLPAFATPALAPGITGAGFANSPAFAPGAGARGTRFLATKPALHRPCRFPHGRPYLSARCFTATCGGAGISSDERTVRFQDAAASRQTTRGERLGASAYLESRLRARGPRDERLSALS